MCPEKGPKRVQKGVRTRKAGQNPPNSPYVLGHYCQNEHYCHLASFDSLARTAHSPPARVGTLTRIGQNVEKYGHIVHPEKVENGHIRCQNKSDISGPNRRFGVKTCPRIWPTLGSYCKGGRSFRLKVRLGQNLGSGGSDFRVLGLIGHEPDRPVSGQGRQKVLKVKLRFPTFLDISDIFYIFPFSVDISYSPTTSVILRRQLFPADSNYFPRTKFISRMEPPHRPYRAVRNRNVRCSRNNNRNVSIRRALPQGRSHRLEVGWLDGNDDVLVIVHFGDSCTPSKRILIRKVDISAHFDKSRKLVQIHLPGPVRMSVSRTSDRVADGFYGNSFESILENASRLSSLSATRGRGALAPRRCNRPPRRGSQRDPTGGTPAASKSTATRCGRRNSSVTLRRILPL